MAAAVAEPAGRVHGLAGEIFAVMGMVAELPAQAEKDPGLNVPGEVLVLHDLVSTLCTAAEAAHRVRAGEARHRSVRALAAAAIHLSRAGRDVPVALGCQLAAGDLATAAEMLRAYR